MTQQLRSRILAFPVVTAVAIVWLGSPSECRGNDANPVRQPTTHVVGDGDVLNVTVPTLFAGPIAITDDGLLRLAHCDPIPVRGLNLEQVQRVVLKEMREFDPALDVAVTLIVPRHIRISIVELVEGGPRLSSVRLAPTEQNLPSALKKAGVAIPEGHAWRLRLSRLNGKNRGATELRLEKLLSAAPPVDRRSLDSLLNSEIDGRAGKAKGAKAAEVEQRSLQPLREGDILVVSFQQP